MSELRRGGGPRWARWPGPASSSARTALAGASPPQPPRAALGPAGERGPRSPRPPLCRLLDPSRARTARQPPSPRREARLWPPRSSHPSQVYVCVDTRSASSVLLSQRPAEAHGPLVGSTQALLCHCLLARTPPTDSTGVAGHADLPGHEAAMPWLSRGANASASPGPLPEPQPQLEP